MTARAIARQSDIRRAIEGAKRAGMRVVGYEVSTSRLLLDDAALATEPPRADADPFAEGIRRAQQRQPKKGARSKAKKGARRASA